MRCRLDAIELGDKASIPRGLHELRLGDGVNGGLPGNDGAHTICSGDTELLLLFIIIFSLPSCNDSMFIRCKSLDTDDEIDADRSRYERSIDRRRTDKSNGVVLPSLIIGEGKNCDWFKIPK